MLLTQVWLVQSLPAVHLLPAAQVEQVAPPQSTSVSAPFFTLSEQVGDAHSLPLHTLLLQSAVWTQPYPSSRGEPAPPPQSMSVSLPFFTLSEQVGTEHFPPAHTPLAQS